MAETQIITTMIKYKQWANNEILASMPMFDPQAHATERHTAIRILNHTYVVDRIFAAHLTQVRHDYAAPFTTETPTLELLSADIKTSDEWYVGYVTDLTPAQLDESIDFTFTDGDPGRMTRAEMLAHLALHGDYHRGAVGRIMSQLSIKPPEAFTAYLHKTEPSARRRLPQ